MMIMMTMMTMMTAMTTMTTMAMMTMIEMVKVIELWNVLSDKRKKLFCTDKIVIKSKEVEIAKEVKGSDSLWRFACGDVYIYLYDGDIGGHLGGQL